MCKEFEGQESKALIFLDETWRIQVKVYETWLEMFEFVKHLNFVKSYKIFIPTLYEYSMTPCQVSWFFDETLILLIFFAST